VEPAAHWRVWTSFVLALLGLGMSTYLTVVHFVGNQILACTSNSVFNCEAVITSPQSYVFGIPVAVLGLVYYVVMAGVCSPWAWRASDRRVHLGRLAMVVVGIGFVLYLISAELLIVKSICELCTTVHVVTFAQLLLVVATVPAMLGWGRGAPAPAPRNGRPAQRSSGATRAGGARKRTVTTAVPRRR
jgi:uncharacterized membrane protein